MVLNASPTVPLKDDIPRSMKRTVRCISTGELVASILPGCVNDFLSGVVGQSHMPRSLYTFRCRFSFGTLEMLSSLEIEGGSR